MPSISLSLMETDRNHAVLRGFAEAVPHPSHSNHGVSYDAFPLKILRLSGTADLINVVAPVSLLERQPIRPGQMVEITGEVRSFNNRTGSGPRLVITLLARSIVPAEGDCDNQLALSGTLCKPPVLRRTPLGREICDLLLAVNRRYGRSDYLPCIAWGSLARCCALLSVGDPLSLTGRLQSRIYHKELNGVLEERTAYEISVMTLEPEAERLCPLAD